LYNYHISDKGLLEECDKQDDVAVTGAATAYCSKADCKTFCPMNGASSKLSNIIIRHIDNRKLLLICILLLSHSVIVFRFLFYKNMVVIYVFLLEEAMYCYCCLCILIVNLCILIVSLCILIVSLCILIVVYVFLLFSMYSYS